MHPVVLHASRVETEANTDIAHWSRDGQGYIREGEILSVTFHTRPRDSYIIMLSGRWKYGIWLDSY